MLNLNFQSNPPTGYYAYALLDTPIKEWSVAVRVRKVCEVEMEHRGQPCVDFKPVRLLRSPLQGVWWEHDKSTKTVTVSIGGWHQQCLFIHLAGVFIIRK